MPALAGAALHLSEQRRIALEAALGMKAQADAARAAELAALGIAWPPQ